jgi:hypothetical protein
MANFKIPENKEDISWFDLPLNRTMKLLQWGGDATNKKLKLALDRSLPSVVLTVLPDNVPAASTLFTLKGSAVTSEFGVTACVAGTTVRYSTDLKVQVGNNPTKQPGYTVDLLSDVALHGNALQVYRYSRVMRDPPNNTHILSQRTTGVLNCGDTAAAYGVISNPDPKFYLNAPIYKAKFIFSKPVYVQNRLYYLPPKSDKMADLRFNANHVRIGIAKIKQLLSDGQPVRVWLIHHDGFARPVIRGDRRTHYLTIIGFSATKFLYLDPWPGGSSLQYDGGMYPKNWIAFMGELEFDPSHLDMGIVSPSTAAGAHKYKVLAGP